MGIYFFSFFKKIFFYFLYFILKFYLFFYYFYFLAALGLCCCVRAFSSCCELGLLFVVVRGFSCCGARALGTWASVVVACELSSCGLRALEHRLSSCRARA